MNVSLRVPVCPSGAGLGNMPILKFVLLAFPEITVRPKKHTFAHSPWMTPGLLISCKSRQKLLRAKKMNPSDQNITRFRSFNKIFTACRRKAQALYYTEKFSQC